MLTNDNENDNENEKKPHIVFVPDDVPLHRSGDNIMLYQ